MKMPNFDLTSALGRLTDLLRKPTNQRHGPGRRSIFTRKSDRARYGSTGGRPFSHPKREARVALAKFHGVGGPFGKGYLGMSNGEYAIYDKTTSGLKIVSA
jgi:hypothetical protein